MKMGQRRWRRHHSKRNLLWRWVRGICTAGRLGLRLVLHKWLRIVWSETFTPAVVLNSCENVQAWSVWYLKLRVLMKLSWYCVVTLGCPDLALSHMEFVTLRRLKSLEIATPNVSATFLQDKPVFYPFHLMIQNQG